MCELINHQCRSKVASCTTYNLYGTNWFSKWKFIYWTKSKKKNDFRSLNNTKKRAVTTPSFALYFSTPFFLSWTLLVKQNKKYTHNLSDVHIWNAKATCFCLSNTARAIGIVCSRNRLRNAIYIYIYNKWTNCTYVWLGNRKWKCNKNKSTKREL